jgi:hypothetical protein
MPVGAARLLAEFFEKGDRLAKIQEIIDRRSREPAYDEALWAFASEVNGRNLINASDVELQTRLNAIDCNIQYLDSGTTPRDGLSPDDKGWLSPWWWLRARYWTMLEFEHRHIVPGDTPEIPSMPAIAAGMTGVIDGGKKMLVRISKVGWLMETLQAGVLRFAPANSYSDMVLDAARGDDELNKSYLRPGQAVTITRPDGRKIKALGDVIFSTSRSVEQGIGSADVPYWMCSFSSDLDPRLFNEFANTDPGEDACLVIFEPYEFVRRALPSLHRAAPRAEKSLFPTVYFDPYYVHRDKLSALKSKNFRYAYQREMRFVLDPVGGYPLANGGALFVEIGSIADIAGVYHHRGGKLAGAGPNQFLK